MFTAFEHNFSNQELLQCTEGGEFQIGKTKENIEAEIKNYAFCQLLFRSLISSTCSGEIMPNIFLCKQMDQVFCYNSSVAL
jgi:hypothetical protein